MACGDFSTYIEFIRQDQLWDAVFCPFADTMGAPVFGLLVFGALGLSLYISTGRIEMPLVVMMLVGAAAAPFAPTFVISAAVVAFLVVFPAAGLLVVRRVKAGV